MSTLIERPFYPSQVCVSSEKSSHRSRACVDVIPIRFHFWKSYGLYNLDTQELDLQEKILLNRKTLKLRFSREKATESAQTKTERLAKYKRTIDRSPREAKKLYNKLRRYVCNIVGVSLVKHPYVVEKLFTVIREEAVPNQIIEVEAGDCTLRFPEESVSTFPDWDDEFYRVKLTAATESSIQALEEVSLPDGELKCAICMDMFAEKKYLPVTQLGCSHYFHQHCIVPWLRINRHCPTCRHPFSV